MNALLVVIAFAIASSNSSKLGLMEDMMQVDFSNSHIMLAALLHSFSKISLCLLHSHMALLFMAGESSCYADKEAEKKSRNCLPAVASLMEQNIALTSVPD